MTSHRESIPATSPIPRPGLEISRDGDHVHDDHRGQQQSGNAAAVTLQCQRLKIVACHRAGMGGDGLDDAEQGSDQESHPGQLVAGGGHVKTRLNRTRWACPRFGAVRYSRPIGRRSQCAANGTRSTWATITFLGEQLDTTGPPRAQGNLSTPPSRTC
jgi:hypothetical protein